MSWLDKVKGFVTGSPSSQQSGPVEIPGLFDKATGAGYVNKAIGMTGQPFKGQGLFDQFLQRQAGQSPYSANLQRLVNNPTASPYGNLSNLINNPTASPYSGALQNAILNPTFGASNPAEQALIDKLYSGRQGQFNALGIGDSGSAQNSIASAAAPALLDFRQQQIGNLMGGQQQFEGERRGTIADMLSGQQQFEGERRGTIADLLSAEGGYNEQSNALVQNAFGGLKAELAAKGIDIEALLKAASYGLPQVSTASSGSGPQKGFLDYFNDTFGSGGAFGSGGGGGPLVKGLAGA